MNTQQPIVAVNDVHVSFGDVRALTGASLSIDAGTVYGLLGANGAGKTTLINVPSTLLRPDRGTASINGTDVTQDPQKVRRSIGLAGQFAAVDDYQTGFENVEMVGRLYGLGKADARRRSREVLDRFQLLVQISTFGAGQTAIGLTEDLSNGVISRFRSLPMARSAVLAGRTLADLIRNAFAISLMIVVGFAIGFRYQTTLPRFIGGVALVLLFAYSLSWVMAAIGLKVRSPEAANTAVFLPVFPFVFASAVFVPPETMPSWLETFAEHQPVTIVAQAASGLMLGEGTLGPGQTVAGQVLLAVARCVGITLVAAPLAVRVYRRSAT